MITQRWLTTMLQSLVLVQMARGFSLVLNHSLYQPIHDQCYGPMCEELRITDRANLCCEIQFFSPIPITYTALFQNYCHLPHQNRCAHKKWRKEVATLINKINKLHSYSSKTKPYQENLTSTMQNITILWISSIQHLQNGLTIPFRFNYTFSPISSSD